MTGRRAWAGSDDDVFECLTSNNRVASFTMVAPGLIRGYVKARGEGLDPVPAMLRAHMGESFPIVPGSASYDGMVDLAKRFDCVVAALRAAGENVLGGVE